MGCPRRGWGPCTGYASERSESIDAVRVVATGEALLAPAVTRRLIAEFARLRRPASPIQAARAAAMGTLTPRETEVLSLVAEGLSNPQIGVRLYISRRTVQAHLAHIFAKLDLTSRAQLAALVAGHRGGQQA